MTQPYSIEIKLRLPVLAFDSPLQAHQSISKELEKLKFKFNIIEVSIKDA